MGNDCVKESQRRPQRQLHYGRKSSQLSDYSEDGIRHVYEPTVRIGAFNVKRFGKAKMRKASTVQVLSRIIRRYDVLLVQEIVDASETAIQELVDAVNDDLPVTNEFKYALELSPRIGRGSAKEQYAFLYRVSLFNCQRYT